MTYIANRSAQPTILCPTRDRRSTPMECSRICPQLEGTIQTVEFENIYEMNRVRRDDLTTSLMEWFQRKCHRLKFLKGAEMTIEGMQSNRRAKQPCLRIQRVKLSEDLRHREHLINANAQLCRK